MNWTDFWLKVRAEVADVSGLAFVFASLLTMLGLVLGTLSYLGLFESGQPVRTCVCECGGRP